MQTLPNTQLSEIPCCLYDEYLREAEQAHGHLCAGQVLGVRMAMLGIEKLGIEDPRGKRRSQTSGHLRRNRPLRHRRHRRGHRMPSRKTRSEIPRLGKDGGDLRADVSTGKAIRIAAKESSKALARTMHPEIESKNQQQMLAYREMAEDDLFTKQWVKVELPAEEFPGYKGERIVCAECGEGINFRREVLRDGRVLVPVLLGRAILPRPVRLAWTAEGGCPYVFLSCSYACATRSSVASSKCRANNCSPIGSFS